MLTASFGLKFEGNQIPVPRELQEEKNLKWQEIEFVSFDQYTALSAEGKWVVLLVTESGEMYRQEQVFDVTLSEDKGIETKEKDSTLHKLETFTGEISFGAYVTTEGDNDYSIFYKATFHNGKFEKVETLQVKAVNNEKRINSYSELNQNIMRQVRRQKNPLYRFVYVPFKVILTTLFTIVAFVWILPLRILGWLIGRLTPI